MGTFVHGISSPASGTEPFDRIMVESPFGSKKFTAHDDAGGLKAGLLCYRTGTTQSNDMTVGGAIWGSSPDEAKIYVVEIQADGLNMPQPYDKATAYSANDTILIREVRQGDRLWLKASTLTVAEDEMVVMIAAGLVDNTGDPDGVAIDLTGHGFVSLGSMTSGTWMLGEYLGIIAFDASA